MRALAPPAGAGASCSGARGRTGPQRGRTSPTRRGRPAVSGQADQRDRRRRAGASARPQVRRLKCSWTAAAIRWQPRLGRRSASDDPGRDDADPAFRRLDAGILARAVGAGSPALRCLGAELPAAGSRGTEATSEEEGNSPRGRRCAVCSQRGRQACGDSSARGFPPAKAGQMRRQELRVEQPEPARPQPVDRMGQRDSSRHPSHG
jgi:hypothetical protein